MAAEERVEFSDYALRKMHFRNILEDEVIAALERPASAHKHRPDGRREVKARIAGRKLLVIYRRLDRRTLVINAMWE